MSPEKMQRLRELGREQCRAASELLLVGEMTRVVIDRLAVGFEQGNSYTPQLAYLLTSDIERLSARLGYRTEVCTRLKDAAVFAEAIADSLHLAELNR